MEIVYNSEDLRPGIPSVAAIGVFDGVHIGHQAIMKSVKTAAVEMGIRSVVITFEDNPEILIHPDTPAPLITTLSQKLDLIEKQGIDLSLVLPVTWETLSTPPEDFVSGILHGRLRSSQVVIGSDFVFGRKRAGNPELLQRMGEELGFHVVEVPPVRVGDIVVSSTSIRGLISEGNISTANTLLGHPFVLQGKVVSGRGMGRLIGFPTANLDPNPRQVLPSSGVYKVSVEYAGRDWVGVANIGFRPTFGESDISVEIHLIGFSSDLYGQKIEVAFHRRLRDELRFDSTPALVAQIAADIQEALRSAD